MGSIISTFMEYLPTLLNAAKTVPQVLEYVNQQKATLQTTAEWTPGQEAEFNKRLEEVTAQPHWQPEQ